MYYDALLVLSIALLSVSTVIFSLITLSIIFAKIPEFPTLPVLVQRRIENYFNNINQLYSKKGFWWRIEPKYLYIEMVIEDKIPPGLDDSRYQKSEDKINLSSDEIKPKKGDKKSPEVTQRSKASRK